jgi:multiple sugar transport system ATP-binding protein
VSDVQLHELTKVYANNVVAVDRLDLHVRDGELLVIVGPSGCGKTTILRLIAGLDEPTAGTVRIGDRDVTALPPARRNVAMVFQNATLYPHLRVEGNLTFGLRMRKVPRAEARQRVADMADLLGLTDLLRRRPWELSGGQQRLVALGRALAVPADCYLLDEPLSHLDTPTRRELRQTIVELHERLGRTMIHVTHDQDEAMSTAHRMAVLSDGRLQQCDRPQMIYRYPVNRFVARLVGPMPMNLTSGRLTRHEGRLVFQHKAVRVPLPSTIADDLPGTTMAQVVLGVRPEAIRKARSDVNPDATFSLNATVETVKALGDRVALQLCGPDGTSWLACTTADAGFGVGQRETFEIKTSDLYLFSDDEVGRNLMIDNQRTSNAE